MLLQIIFIVDVQQLWSQRCTFQNFPWRAYPDPSIYVAAMCLWKQYDG